MLTFGVRGERRMAAARQLLLRQEREGSGQTGALLVLNGLSVAAPIPPLHYPYCAAVACLPHTHIYTHTWTGMGQLTLSAFWQTRSLWNRLRPSSN